MEPVKPMLTRCEGCPFKSGILVGSRGPEDSPFVIVGESPGRYEVKERKPFVGPSWDVLHEGLKQHLPSEYPEPYITNAFKCFPGNNKDQTTTAQATQACRKCLLEELKRYPRKVVLALGNPAIWAVTGDYSLKITQVRGKLFPTEVASIGAVASVHPAFLMRGGGSFRQFKADVDYAVRLAQGHPPKNPGNVTWELMDTPQKIISFCAKVNTSKAPTIASDFETTGFSYIKDKLICAGYTFDGKHAYIVPTLDQPHLIPYLRYIHRLRSRFVWHNGKFDVKFAHRNGVPEAKVDEDTMLLSYALDEKRGIHDLEQVASDVLGSPNWKKALHAHIPKGGSYADAPRDKLYLYLAKDLKNTFDIFNVYRPIVANDPTSEKLYSRTLIPASTFLAEVEKVGMTVDLERVQANEEGELQEDGTRSGGMLQEAKKYEDEINVIAIECGCGPVNPNSTQQMAELFYDYLKIPTIKGSRSTNADTLEKLPQHPAVVALAKRRKVFKGLSTYVIPAKEHMESDGRIHSTYLLHGTATGRLASRNPNVQNIPRDPKLRGQFVAGKGRIFIEPDLNQAELRSLALLSGDPELCRIYSTEGVGLHEEVRAEIFGQRTDWSEQDIVRYAAKWSIPMGEETTISRILEEQKMRAKNVNFGIVYGITAVGLSEQIEDTPKEAGFMLSRWAKKFPVAWEFINKCRMAPLRGQNLVTVFGYRKRFGVVSPEALVATQNEAANFPHQNTASSITLHAGIEMHTPLKQFDAHIANLVHDSLLIDTPDDDDAIRGATQLAIETMERIPIDWGLKRIPFKSDAKMGYRWGSLLGMDKFWKAREQAREAAAEVGGRMECA